MSAHTTSLHFTRGSHQYAITGVFGRGEYVGTRDGAVIARGHDRHSVARALIIAGTPIKRRIGDA